MQKFVKFLRIGFKIFFAGAVLGLGCLIALYLYLEPKLPSIEGLQDVQLQVPLRVYSAEGGLIAEYGEKRRSPKQLDEIPLQLRQAFLAAEDDRFYQHPGVDYQGILRAMVHLMKTGERGQGGSTITMQLARNFYLSREKTFGRKLNEIFLALKIEQQLSKDEVLALYLNKMYYGKSLEQLDLSQIAMIAGLPKAPSRYNPVINPERAVTRRNYVLKRMAELGFISDADYRWAEAQPTTAGLHDSPVEVSAYYVAEMVRSEISRQFGEDAYTRGLRVYTTIDGHLQEAANEALRNALLAYDQRHGYRGAEQRVDIGDDVELREDRVKHWEASLEDLSPYGNLQAALVVETGEKDARVYVKGGRLINLDWEAVSWARPYIDVNTQGKAPEKMADVIKAGDIIRIYRDTESHWKMGQIPEVQGALTSLVPNDGAIKALVGGYDFQQSKFNRAVQAKRQAGSSFKPFIYTAALEKDYTPASIINDAPVVFHDPALEGTWRPENYSGKFYGPTRLREALVNSRNLVSIRLLRSIGIRYAIDFVGRFGFDTASLPRDLSLALGSGEVSPLELSTGFSVFANGGYKVDSYFIQRIEDLEGNVLYEADPVVACVSCVINQRGLKLASTPPAPQPPPADQLPAAQQPKSGAVAAEGALPAEENLDPKLPTQAERAVDERTVYIMNSILQDVIQRGTGRRARVLGRNDLHGKTGTTNDQKDAWFNGFNRSLVATAWVGFDQQTRPLGNYETGSKAALPMWIDYMRTALQGVPEEIMARPDNLVTVKINPETGELAGPNDTDAIFEIFRAERAPKEKIVPHIPSGGVQDTVIPEQLF